MAPSDHVRPAGPAVVLTGAGLSTASGIPDFRSPGGVWDRFDPDEFTIQRFHDDPARFWRRRARLVAEMGTLDAQPNAAHQALAAAVQDGRVETVVTQNVDGLHTAAGTPPEQVIEVHGNGRRSRCLACSRSEAIEATLERVGRRAPRCTACSGLVKPDVVLFGEPVTLLDRAAEAVERAASLVVVGSSLQVHPVAGLVDLARHSGVPVWILNREATPYDAQATVLRGDVLDTVLTLFPPETQPMGTGRILTDSSIIL